MMKNYVDAMADALVDVLKYSDSSVEWPDIDDLQYDEAIKPEWFYPALQSEGESEPIHPDGRVIRRRDRGSRTGRRIG